MDIMKSVGGVFYRPCSYISASEFEPSRTRKKAGGISNGGETRHDWYRMHMYRKEGACTHLNIIAKLIISGSCLLDPRICPRRDAPLEQQYAARGNLSGARTLK